MSYVSDAYTRRKISKSIFRFYFTIQMSQEIRTTLLYKISYLVFLMIGWVILWFTITYLQIYFAPVTSYFEYKSVEPAREVFDQWQEVKFTSTITRYKPVNMKYYDILRCDIDWIDSVRYSQSITYWKWMKVGDIVSTRRYEWVLPKEWNCYLEARPTALLDFWIEKTQVIMSNPFIISK